MHPSHVNGSPLDPKWLLFQIKKKSRTDCQFKHTARQWVVCRQLLCEIHSQHDPRRRGTAARWSNALSKLRENCASYVTAPTGGTTCTFWAVRFTAADESPFPIGAHFHSHGQGSTSTCFLSPGLFKDGRCFPLSGLYNVALICFMSVLQQRQAPETWRQSSRWTLGSAKSRMAARRRRPRSRIAGSKQNNIHISWATAEMSAVASDVLGRWGWPACYFAAYWGPRCVTTVIQHD